METIKKQFDNMLSNNLLPLFEIEVINKETQEPDYIICNIFVTEDQMYCQRIAVSTEEQQSDKIATSSIDIDNDFSLDYHLQGLMEEITCDILNGGLFELI